MYSERSNGAGSGGSARGRGQAAGRPTARKRAAHGVKARHPFILYVEGPGDCDILRSWARRLSSELESTIANACVILGGRQPARAADHFQRARSQDAETRGLCVLDRDDHGSEAEPQNSGDAGLEFFTWPQRHIESYLLVPAAIGRLARSDRDASSLEQLVARLRRSDGNHARRGPGGVDAKRLLAPKGPLSRELGTPISPAGVARAMRRDEIHPEVHGLFDRVSDAAGLRRCTEPVVVHRVDRGGSQGPPR